MRTSSTGGHIIRGTADQRGTSFGLLHIVWFCSIESGADREAIARLTEEQTGERTLPAEDPNLMFLWPEIIKKIEEQLARKPRSWGRGQTRSSL